MTSPTTALTVEHIKRGFFSFDEMILLSDAIREQFHDGYAEEGSPVKVFSEDLDRAISKWNGVVPPIPKPRQ